MNFIPAYAPPGTPAGIQYYMVEIELITGTKVNADEEQHAGSQFAYYYGLITTEDTPDEGWKIKNIHYIPEDFLCAPMHSWFYPSEAIMQIVYGDNLKLIDKIDISFSMDIFSTTETGKKQIFWAVSGKTWSWE